MVLAPMDMIPKPFMNDIENRTGQIGKDNYTQSDIVSAGDGKDDKSVGNENEYPKCNRFNNRPPDIFVKLYRHEYTISNIIYLNPFLIVQMFFYNLRNNFMAFVVRMQTVGNQFRNFSFRKLIKYPDKIQILFFANIYYQ